jgi:pimeloyl-ACP methyl ester carboxylesterase
MTYNPIFEDQRNVPPEYPAGMKSVTFASEGSRLVGTMFISHGSGPHPTVLLLHGFPGNENNFDLAHIIRRLGWNVFVFHYRGSWGSEGDYSFNNSLEDISAAVEFLGSESSKLTYRCDPGKIVLIGHSLGGFGALIKAAEFETIRNAASFAAFNFGFLTKLISTNEDARSMAMDYLKVGADQLKGTSAEKLFTELVEHADSWNLLDKAQELSRKNLMLICGTYDSISMPEIHHYPLIKAIDGTGEGKLRHFELPTGHSFSDKRIKLAGLVIDWLNKIEW